MMIAIALATGPANSLSASFSCCMGFFFGPTMKNSPSFQYYPADLLTDPDLLGWDMEMIGLYWITISYLWINGGFLNDKPEVICQLTRNYRTDKAQRLWRKIQHKFLIVGGKITHKRVTKEMQKQTEYRLMKKKAGKAGADKRWQTHDFANGKPIAEGMADGMAKNSSSSSSSSSTSVIPPYPPPKFITDPDTNEVYQAWADRNGGAGVIECYYNQWRQAVVSHTKDTCLKYIEKTKSTKPGFIINQMDKDSADGKMKKPQTKRVSLCECGTPITMRNANGVPEKQCYECRNKNHKENQAGSVHG